MYSAAIWYVNISTSTVQYSYQLETMRASEQIIVVQYHNLVILINTVYSTVVDLLLQKRRSIVLFSLSWWWFDDCTLQLSTTYLPAGFEEQIYSVIVFTRWFGFSQSPFATTSTQYSIRYHSVTKLKDQHLASALNTIQYSRGNTAVVEKRPLSNLSRHSLEKKYGIILLYLRIYYYYYETSSIIIVLNSQCVLYSTTQEELIFSSCLYCSLYRTIIMIL